jgi:hypothetical protein
MAMLNNQMVPGFATIWCLTTTSQEDWSFWTGILQLLHVSRNLSGIFAGTWLLEENIFFCLTGYLPCISKIVSLQDLLRNTALVHWILHFLHWLLLLLKKVAAHWKTRYIWYRNISCLRDRIPFGRRLHFVTRNAASFRGFLHIL